MRVVAVLFALLIVAVPSQAAVAGLDDLDLDLKGVPVIETMSSGPSAPNDDPAPPADPASPFLPAAKSSRTQQALRSVQSSHDAPSLDDIVDLATASLPFSRGDASAPDGLVGLWRLQEQQPSQPDPNGTQTGPNGTILEQNHTGVHTHAHPVGGDLGLGAVWSTPFYGTPTETLAMDVDGDDMLDALTGTDVAIVALSGRTGEVLWAYMLGNTITSLFAVDVDGDGTMEIGFSTLWEAQNARVGVLDAATGVARWETPGELAFIGAAATGDGDVVAIDIDGTAHRFAGKDGTYQWSTLNEMLDDEDPTIGIVYTEYGHYLRDFADLNGDGITDTISAGLYHIAVPIAIDNVYTVLHAVDGATGDKLWIHAIGAEPPVLGVAITLLSGLNHLDGRGDGSMDVSYSGWTYRWPLLWLLLVPVAGLAAIAFMHYETYVRVVDGDSQNGVAEPMGGRTLFMPVLDVLEFYHDVDRVDLDDDGREELAVVRNDIATTTLEGAVSQLEFYRIPASAERGPPDLVLSPKTHHFNMTAFIADGDEGGVVVLGPGLFGGLVATVDRQGDLINAEWADRRPLAADANGGDLVLASLGQVAIRDVELGAGTAGLLRGRPIQFAQADHDGDGTPDVWVLGNDGAIHVVDGVNGNFLATIDIRSRILDFHLQDIDDDGDLDLQVLREGGINYLYTLESLDAADLTTNWAVESNVPEPFWYQSNGDGVLDAIAVIDTVYDTFSVINGATGDQIMLGEVPYNRVTGLDVISPTNGTRQDLIFYDYFYGIALVDGDVGTTKWTYEPGYTYGMCGVAADLDGDGAERYYVIFEDFFSIQQVEISSGGGARDINMLPSDVELAGCDMMAVHDDAGDSLLVVATYFDDDLVSVTKRWDGSTVWSSNGLVFSQAGFQSVLGAATRDHGSGRIYHASEDHVLARDWSSGALVGEFVANGPFVEDGTLVELDGTRPAEVLALTGDGMLWALSDDVQNVTAVLHDVAVDQGKQGLEVADAPTGGEDKESPGIGLGAFFMLLAALAVARRRVGKR